MKGKQFLVNALKGGAIGLAMIVPGVSGGTLAVLLGVYDKIIDALGNLFKKFKESALFLLPVLIGAVLAFAALFFPLKYALLYIPFPTMLLFSGLMLGSCPDLISSARANGFKRADIAAILLPLAAVVGICFIPNLGEANLGADMPAYGYALLFLAGLLASCALVVPGISGSMLMLILGYYAPLLSTISALTTSFGHSLLVLALFAAGVIVGFFTIAKLMQLLLDKFRRATFWAIVGFVLGSVPAVIITFFNDAARVATLNGWQIAVGVILFVGGAVASYLLTRLAHKRAPSEESGEQPAAQPGAPAEPPADGADR